MSKIKLRLITIVSLILLFALSLSLAIGFLPAGVSADAAAVAPTSVFWAGTGGTVDTNRPSQGADENETYYVRLNLADGGKAHFHRNLALKWFESSLPAEEEEEGGEAAAAAETAEGLVDPGVAKFFHMSFSFPEVRFTTLTISFDSAEENITKDGKTTNALVFTNSEEDGFAVAVHDSYDREGLKAEKKPLADKTAVFTLSIDDADCGIGEFNVYLASGEADPVLVGKFTNIGGYFLQYYSASATVPSTPITFEADLPDLPASDPASDVKQEVLLHDLNGQSLKVNESGRVEDDARPVLVLNEALYSLRLGKQFSPSYQAIDVIRDSVQVERSYYFANEEEGVGYVKPNRKDVAEDEAHNYKKLAANDYITPPNDGSESEVTHLSIRFLLKDQTFDDTYAYLSWYAAKDPDVTVVEKLGEGENAYDYLVADLEAKGPVFTILTADEATKTNVPTDGEEHYNEVLGAYQDALTEAASAVSAGDGAYLYLPSLRNLITSKYADYRNLSFSIYYQKPQAAVGATASSATSLKYNNLRIEVDQDGDYKMRIVAQDAAGNAMEYYEENGDLPVKVTSSNVWKIEGIPEFTFTIRYDGPSIEDVKKPTDGFRDQTYTISDFDIVALEGYTKEYTLYYLDTDKAPEGGVPEYGKLFDELDDYIPKFEEWEALTEIEPYNDEVSEDDEEWDLTFNDYEWDPDSKLSFRPQKSGFYLVKVVVSDGKIKNLKEEAWTVINITNPLDTIPGQSKWLQNNRLAIIFFSIAAVLLIAVILLFVIKPSEKGVEEVDLSKLKGKKNRKE